MSNLADVFTKYKAVVFFDTETSGLDANTCQIIELAAIRIEQTARGTLRMADTADMFVKLPEGEKLPEQITNLTGITDELLEAEGVTEGEAAARFTDMLRGGPVLLVAHNAQFDLLFCRAMICGTSLTARNCSRTRTIWTASRFTKTAGHILTSWQTRSSPTSWRTKCRTPTGRSTTWPHCLRYARPWTTSGPTFWSM